MARYASSRSVSDVVSRAQNAGQSVWSASAPEADDLRDAEDPRRQARPAGRLGGDEDADAADGDQGGCGGDQRGVPVHGRVDGPGECGRDGDAEDDRTGRGERRLVGRDGAKALGGDVEAEWNDEERAVVPRQHLSGHADCDGGDAQREIVDARHRVGDGGVLRGTAGLRGVPDAAALRGRSSGDGHQDDAQQRQREPRIVEGVVVREAEAGAHRVAREHRQHHHRGEPSSVTRTATA